MDGSTIAVLGLMLMFTALGLFVAFVVIAAKREERPDLDALRRDWEQRMADVLGHETRYEIRLADWGPDFTGYDGTLPRWRWVILDADLAVREEIGQDPKGGVVMLGNARTPQEAYLAAVAWIEREQFPARFVLGRGVFS